MDTCQFKMLLCRSTRVSLSLPPSKGSSLLFFPVVLPLCLRICLHICTVNVFISSCIVFFSLSVIVWISIRHIIFFAVVVVVVCMFRHLCIYGCTIIQFQTMKFSCRLNAESEWTAYWAHLTAHKFKYKYKYTYHHMRPNRLFHFTDLSLSHTPPWENKFIYISKASKLKHIEPFPPNGITPRMKL